jgi:hypothetical protein
MDRVTMFCYSINQIARMFTTDKMTFLAGGTNNRICQGKAAHNMAGSHFKRGIHPKDNIHVNLIA